MSLVFPLVLIAGNVFAIRTLQVFRARTVIAESTLTKIGTAWITAVMTSGFLVPRNPLGLLFVLATIFTPTFLMMWLETSVLRRLSARIPSWLDKWILNLRVGKSISSALEAAFRDEPDAFQSLARPLLRQHHFHHQRHPLFTFVVAQELARLMRTDHAALARLERLREWVRRDSEFRRKSGLAGRQTRLQALTLLGLQVALAAFMLNRYSWSQCGDLVVISFSLTLISLWIMTRLSQKRLWKV